MTEVQTPYKTGRDQKGPVKDDAGEIREEDYSLRAPVFTVAPRGGFSTAENVRSLILGIVETSNHG